jgi:hypothetical protein
MRTRIPSVLLGCTVLFLSTGCSRAGQAQDASTQERQASEEQQSTEEQHLGDLTGDRFALLGTADLDRQKYGAILLVDPARSVGAVYNPPEFAPVCDMVLGPDGGLSWRSEPDRLGYSLAFSGEGAAGEYEGRLLREKYGSTSQVDHPSTWRQVEIGGGPPPLFNNVFSHLWISENTGDQGGFEVVLVALTDGTYLGLFLASQGRLGTPDLIPEVMETEEGVRIQLYEWNGWTLIEAPGGAALMEEGRGRVETLPLKGGLWEELEAAMDRCPVGG